MPVETRLIASLQRKIKPVEKIVSIRGATQANEDSIKGIKNAVCELLKEIIKQNKIDVGKIVNIMFTVTGDLTSIHPAKVAREELELKLVPMLCMQEMRVPDDLPRCIRVMVQTYSDVSKEKIKHVYLKEAENLRPDLTYEF